MSYLDFPRLVVSGSFYTDPSTMDNDPSHYDPSNTNPSPWQDPGGSHHFSFQDLLASQLSNRDFTPPVVVAVFDQNGNASLTDPMINTPVNSTDTPGGLSGVPSSPAKLIDIDVYQQGVSTIYGFFLQLQIGANKIVGAMDPATLNSVWFNRVLPTRGCHEPHGVVEVDVLVAVAVEQPREVVEAAHADQAVEQVRPAEELVGRVEGAEGGAADTDAGAAASFTQSRMYGTTSSST